MKIGVIGDDITGSGGIAKRLAKAGARIVQYDGTPTGHLADEIDVAVIALKTRSVEAGDAIAQSLAACRWLVANGARQIVFKYCSTFDSTPRGNIGPVASPAGGTGHAAGTGLPCLSHQPPHALQRLPLRRRPPAQRVRQGKPSADADDRPPDIRRWLSRQTRLKVGPLPLESLRSGGAEAAFNLAKRNGEKLIVADAITDEDLTALGKIAKTHRLVTGGSGIATGLPSNFGIHPAIGSGSRGTTALDSSSPAVALLRHAGRLPPIGTSILRCNLMQPMCSIRTLPSQADSIFWSATRMPPPWSIRLRSLPKCPRHRPDMGPRTVGKIVRDDFAELTAKAVAAGFRRLVVAGGETSGAVASAFGASALEIDPEIDTGVPVLILNSEPRLASTAVFMLS